MKTLPVFAAVLFLPLVACSPQAGMSVRSYASLGKEGAELPKGPLTFKMTVPGEKGNGLQQLPSKRVAVGKEFTTSVGRDFKYPAAYQPAMALVDGRGVTPAEPRDFKTVRTGTVADLRTKRAGNLIVVEGTITHTAFLGFSKMGGEMGQPILDEKERLITENRIEMPKLATYTTPVYLAMEPGKAYVVPISHPDKGATATLEFDGAE